MERFFKNVFSSCLGAFLAFFLVGLVLFIIVGRVASSNEGEVKVGPNSVLYLTFDKPIPELTDNLVAEGFSFQTDPVLGLTDIQKAILKAKTDKNIKGILLEPKFLSMGKATALTLRRAIEDFRESGKFVYSTSEILAQDGYYLASAADKIFLTPVGGIDFRGFSAQLPFMKDMLDRMGVKMQVVYAGKFKSATEPLRRNEISPENRLQLEEYISQRYELYIEDIAKSRGISAKRIHEIANNFEIRKPEDAVRLGLADSLLYKDQIFDLIKDEIGLEKKQAISFVKLSKYYNPKVEFVNQSAKDKIAVIYAEGTIDDFNKKPGVIHGGKYAKLIRKIRQDDGIKAIVLRVNSGGGSVVASDVILRELLVCKEKGIPVVVSMGDVAASGGYYIAMASDSIFAEPNTLTGSIGVFGVLPSVQKMMADKLGVRFDTVNTGKFSSSFTPFFDLKPEEINLLQQQVNGTYEEFLNIVADGRAMTSEQVNEIAQGRIWTGKKALEIGLVDKLGTLDDALQSAANIAGLKDFKIREFPKAKTQIEQIMETISGYGNDELVKQKLIADQLGKYGEHYEFLVEMANAKTVQARIPFILD